MAPPISPDRLRALTLELLALAAAYERGSAPDPEAEKTLRIVLDLLEKHRHARLDRGAKRLAGILVPEVAAIYRRIKQEADFTTDRQERAIIEVLHGQGLEPTERRLEALVRPAHEVFDGRKGPMDAAKESVGTMLNVVPRTVHSWLRTKWARQTLGPATLGVSMGQSGLFVYALELFGMTQERARSVLDQWRAEQAGTRADGAG